MTSSSPSMPRSAGLVLAMVVVGVLVVGGCSRAEGPRPLPAGLPVPDLDELPEDQRPTFEDGEIDLTEYASAFERFEACANAGGAEAIAGASHDPDTDLISFGVDERVGGDMTNPNSETGRCYYATFRWVEVVFEFTDPDVVDQAEERARNEYLHQVIPCLAEHGILAPPDAELGSRQFVKFTDIWITFISADDC